MYSRTASRATVRWIIVVAGWAVLGMGSMAIARQEDRGRDVAKLFQRAPVVAYAANASAPTLCAENDNVNVAIYGDGRRFTLEAIHPQYDADLWLCEADFDDCEPTPAGYPFTPAVVKLYDDGIYVVEAVRQSEWWKPSGMTVSVNTSASAGDMHYIRVYKKIDGVNSWVQVLVFYSDGNLRLVPQPRPGHADTCFGSSVVVGPAAQSDRPIAEVVSVNYLSSFRTLRVKYADGTKANFFLDQVDRTVCRVRVRSTFGTELPFATFRSMYVSDDNADVARVYWFDDAGQPHDDAILPFAGGLGTIWHFYRNTPSLHNTSAPDIRLRME